MKRRSEVIWGSILLLYGLLVLGSLLSFGAGSGIGAFAATAVSGIVLLLLGVLQLSRRIASSFEPRRGFVIFLIPLVILVLTVASPGAVDAVATHARHDEETERRLLEGDGPLVFNETNYFRLYDVLTAHPELALGREVRIDGFLSRSGPDGPTIGRYLLWCCGSDAVYLGVPLQGSLPAVSEETWIEVYGTVSQTVISDGGGLVPQPVISVEEARVIDEPTFSYVLPF